MTSDEYWTCARCKTQNREDEMYCNGCQRARSDPVSSELLSDSVNNHTLRVSPDDISDIADLLGTSGHISTDRLIIETDSGVLRIEAGDRGVEIRRLHRSEGGQWNYD